MIDYMYSDPHFGHRKLAEVRGYCEKGCSDELLMLNHRLLLGLEPIIIKYAERFDYYNRF
jgi:hypothetical protein